ncbi:MAG: PQQ-binding-like beta-propeller repeat protein [Planctomycetota bacterium]
MRNSLPALLVIFSISSSLKADWPQFRGPDGQGHSQAEGIPTSWSETDNIAWKTRIPGEGWSSPVISDNQIWLTSSKKKGLSLHAICVDRTSGKLLHDIEVLTTPDAGPRHVQNGFASPTPVLDGKHAYVTFGPRGTVCLDTSGKIVWKNTELGFNVIQGAGSSPILHGDLLILTCDGIDVQYIAALDKDTGKVRWKQARQHLERVTRSIGKMAYSTPLAKIIDGVPQLVSSGADHVAAYDLRTGKELWWMPYTGFSQVGRPSYGNGLFYVVGSVSQDHFAIFAVRPGTGQLTDAQVVWKNSSGIGHVPSPLLVGKEIYAVDDKGITSCIDAMTGKVHWKERLGGNYRASPLEIRGKIYTCSREGVCHVLAGGKEYKVLATNKLDGTLMASPAVAGRALFIRSGTHLYRIEKRGK